MKSIIVVHKPIIFQMGNDHGFQFVLFVYQRDPRFIPVPPLEPVLNDETGWFRLYILLTKTRHDFPWCRVRDCFTLFRIRLNMFKLYIKLYIHIFHSSLTQSHCHWGGGAQMTGAPELRQDHLKPRLPNFLAQLVSVGAMGKMIGKLKKLYSDITPWIQTLSDDILNYPPKHFLRRYLDP